MTVRYGYIPAESIPYATRALVAQLVRAVSDDLGITSPTVRWVTDADPRTLPEELRRVMGAKRWERSGPVYGWAEGWTTRTATVYLAWPAADRLTLAHELRHVAQRLYGVGPSDPSDVPALERDAEAYARRFLGMSPLPGPARDRRNDPAPASAVAAILQAERDLYESVRVDRMGQENRELEKARRRGADCGTAASPGARRRYTRATSPVLMARVFGASVPEGPERRIQHAERYGVPKKL